MKKLFTLFLILIPFVLFFYTFFCQAKYQPKKKMINNSQFVTADGRNLLLNGRIFRSVGVNRYNLLSQNDVINCANTFSEEDIKTLFSQLHMLGVTSVRFWMFQSFTGSGENLNRFDYILQEANTYRIKLIPVFENQWDNCTQGGIKSADWFASGYLSPYGNYSLSLKDYIGKIVSLYRNNPDILAWQIINEAQDTDQTGLYNFAKDLSEYIKSIDQNHLVSLGTAGTEQSSKDYAKINGISTINILDYHDYNDIHNSIPDSLHNRFLDSKSLQKPLIVGESGINETISNRSSLMQVKMNAFFQNGGSVYLIWSYGGLHVTDDGYNFDYSDPLSKIIKSVDSNL